MKAVKQVRRERTMVVCTAGAWAAMLASLEVMSSAAGVKFIKNKLAMPMTI
jgi:hypothetical protein